MADEGDNHAKVFVEWKEAMELVVSRAYGKPMMVKSGSAVRVEHEGYSRAHGDGAHFEARTVSVVMDKPSATKRVSIGLARDERPRGTRRLLHSPDGWWIYLGDLVLRNKDTYIGDRVAMGAERVGWDMLSWSSALVHRVNPVQGAEWVLIIDWVPERE